MTTARDVTKMLERHYLPEGRPPGGIFAPEIGSPCGKRRADLIWMPTTIAAGRGMVGHEIKVTRPDVLTELADPSKADPWAKYCTRWWLVVAEPELVDGLEIPQAWGIMAPPSGRRTRSMTVLRPAPPLEPIDWAPGVERLATWMLYRHHEVQHRLAVDVQNRDRSIASRDAEIARLHGEGLRSTSPHAERLGRILTAIEAQARDENLWVRVDDDTVVRAVLDAGHVRQAVADAARVVDRLIGELTGDPVQDAREHLARALAAATADPALAAFAVPAKRRRVGA